MSLIFVYVAFILCITLKMPNTIKASNILGLFTSHHRSHQLVYMSVVKCLLNRGHNVTIVAVLPIEDKPPGALRVVQLKRPLDPKRWVGVFRQIDVVAVNSRVFDDMNLKQFLREDNQFDLVILGYFFNDYQLGVAAHYNCPVVVLWTTQPISFVNRFVGNPNGWWYVPQAFVRSQAVGIRSVFHGVFETAYQYIFDLVMNQVYNQHFPPSKYPSLQQMRWNVSLVLCNHHFSEGSIAARLPTVIEIGGIQIQEKNEIPKDLKEFMDSADDGIIYFSLGTVVSSKQLRLEVFQSFIKVLSKLPQRILWKVDYFPQNFSNIIARNWFPQNSILSHPKTRLFITHAGKGSVIEAIFHAVPTIAMPIFGDQFGDANRLVTSGFGLQVDADTITETSLYICIQEVLSNTTYARKIQIASQIYKDRPISANATAMYWIEHVIHHKGAPHMQTAVKTMNYIQYLNIDVYLFCICAINACMAAWRLCMFKTYQIISRDSCALKSSIS